MYEVTFFLVIYFVEWETVVGVGQQRTARGLPQSTRPEDQQAVTTAVPYYWFCCNNSFLIIAKC